MHPSVTAKASYKCTILSLMHAETGFSTQNGSGEGGLVKDRTAWLKVLARGVGPLNKVVKNLMKVTQYYNQAPFAGSRIQGFTHCSLLPCR